MIAPPNVGFYDCSPPSVERMYHEIIDNFNHHVKIFIMDFAVPSPPTPEAPEQTETYYFIYEIYDVENRAFYLRKRGHEVLQIYEKYGTLWFRHSGGAEEIMLYHLDGHAGCKERHFLWSSKIEYFKNRKQMMYCTDILDLFCRKKQKELFIYQLVRSPPPPRIKK